MRRLALLALAIAPAPALAQQAARPVAVAAAAPTPETWFVGWLNGARAGYGLPALAIDPALTYDAAVNSGIQARRGLGHFHLGSARRQNSGWGALSAMPASWWNSPAHRSALLDPSARFVGLAGAGAFWTLSIR